MADDAAGKEARAAARAAKKEAEKAERAAKAAAKSGAAGGSAAAAEVDTDRAPPGIRTATGTLVSEKNARDIKIDSFSLSLHGRMLVEDTSLELNYGQRYGLLGRNGCGKSSLLKCIAEREVPLPDHIDTYLLEEEAKPSERTALEYVIDSAKAEYARLEVLAEKLLTEVGPDSEALMEVYDRQTELDPATFETRASSILVGLGFNTKTVHKMTKVRPPRRSELCTRHAPLESHPLNPLSYSFPRPRRTCQAAGACASRSRARSSSPRLSSFSTSPRTTSTSRRACGSRTTSRATRSCSLSCRTRRISSTACAP